jgi:hypothetical protein
MQERDEMKMQTEKRKLSRKKDEWLAFNICCHVGMTQEAVSPLFGLKLPSTVSDVVNGWTAFSNVSLSRFCPTPS